MTEHAVVIAGGGPTGMMLAAELALAGIDVAVVERRANHNLVGSRAGGIHARTIEVLDQRGVADRFLAEGQTAQAAMFATQVLDMSDFPTRHPYALGIWQNKIERVMADWIAELPVRIYYSQDVVGFDQDADGVQVRIAPRAGAGAQADANGDADHGSTLRARYLVGCDGGRSLIRKQAGIEFPGWDATKSSLIAEVEVTEETPKGIKHDETGVHGLHVMEDGKTVRVVTSEQQLGPATEATLADLSTTLKAVYGTDFGVHNPLWISRFTDATRQAAAYRSGRVLLAGDSAHIHYPAGGQGLSLGIQDAVNLGWKLAQVINGSAPESLLDSYHDERHPVGARALRHTMAQGVLLKPDARIGALVETVADLMTIDAARVRVAGTISGLDIHYELGDGHPLLGRRMPDLDLAAAAGGDLGGATRVFELMHQARPLLINFAEGSVDAGRWSDRVKRVDAVYDGAWELPVIGSVPAPSSVLVRPDGYVAWVGEGSADGLGEALARWFGPASL